MSTQKNTHTETHTDAGAAASAWEYGRVCIGVGVDVLRSRDPCSNCTVILVSKGIQTYPMAARCFRIQVRAQLGQIVRRRIFGPDHFLSERREGAEGLLAILS